MSFASGGGLGGLMANKTRRTFDDTKKKSATYQSGVNVKVTVSTSSVDL